MNSTAFNRSYTQLDRIWDLQDFWYVCVFKSSAKQKINLKQIIPGVLKTADRPNISDKSDLSDKYDISDKIRQYPTKSDQSDKADQPTNQPTYLIFSADFSRLQPTKPDKYFLYPNISLGQTLEAPTQLKTQSSSGWVHTSTA